MKINSLLGKIATGIALVGALAGCATENSIKIDNLVGRNMNPANAKQEIYSSPVILPEYGFRVIGRQGNVDETNPLYEKDGKLFVVGFSHANVSQKEARNSAQTDAMNRAVRYLYSPKITKNGDGSTTETYVGMLRDFWCGKYEFITVRDKDNAQGTVVETLCETDLKNYKNRK